MLTGTKPKLSQVTVRKALRILGSFSMENPYLSVLDICSITGYPKSTVHRFVSVLIDEGFLEDDTVGKYKLSLKVFELGSIVRENFDLKKACTDVLQRLALDIGETVHLVMRDNTEGMYIDKIELPGASVHYSRIGKRLPLYCTAAGKVLLVDLPETEIRALMGERFEKRTPKTLGTIDDLIAEVRKVRERGWAMDDEELELGLACLGAPVMGCAGDVVAAVSISGLAVRFTQERLPTMVKPLMNAARTISTRLGYKSSGLCDKEAMGLGQLSGKK